MNRMPQISANINRGRDGGVLVLPDLYDLENEICFPLSTPHIIVTGEEALKEQFGAVNDENLAISYSLGGETKHILSRVDLDAFNELYKRASAGDYVDGVVIPTLENGANAHRVGEYVQGHGLYLGGYRPQDEKLFSLSFDGEAPLCVLFDIYASPALLKKDSKRESEKYRSFPEVMGAGDDKKDWYGHDFEIYKNEETLFEALRSGTYKGGWFAPTRNILSHKIYPNKKQGWLKNTFDWDKDYWTCDRMDASKDASPTLTIYMGNSNVSFDGGYGAPGALFLPVRLEARKNKTFKR